MFKLVGTETFRVGLSKTRATISIEAACGLSYQYSLLVDGRSLQDFTNNRAKTTKTWDIHVDGTDHRIVLGESTGRDAAESDLTWIESTVLDLDLYHLLCPTEKDTMDIWCNGQKMDSTVRPCVSQLRGRSWFEVQT